MAGDADEACEALLAGVDDHLEGLGPPVEFVDRGDPVGLVEVEVVDLEAGERLVEA